MDSEEQALLEIYEAFCSFGAGQDRSLFGPSLDSAKFAKLCKDSRIIDVKQGITTTDVDIIFNKAKAKGDRRLNFEQFKTALAMLGQRRFPQYDSASAYAAMVDLILEGNISVSGTFAQSNDVVDRLTDVSGYTGTHKNRFNADGTGKGLAGRDSVAKGSGSKGGQVYHGGDVKDLSQILRPEMNGSRTALTGSSRTLAGGSRNSLASASASRQSAVGGSTQKLAGSSSSLAASSTQKRTTTLSMDELANERKKTAASGSNYSLHSASGSKASLHQQPRAVTGSSLGLSQKGGSVFDRLTDSKGYTGTHAQRFDEHGNGRGLGGRDSVVKGSGTVGAYRGGDVKELSQILRR